MRKHLVIDLRWVRDISLDGVSRYSIEVVKRILPQTKRLKIRVTLLFDKEEVRRKVTSLLSGNSFQVFKVPFPVLSLKEPILLPRILEHLGSDLFFSPNYFTYPFNGKTKVVLVVHYLTQYVSPETSQGNLKWKIFFSFKFPAKIILNKADKIITDSISTKRDIIKLSNINAEKILVTYLAADKKFFERVGEEDIKRIKHKYRLPEKYILSVSIQDPRKNLKNLIRAYKQINEKLRARYKLVIAGRKHPKFYSILEDLVKKLNLEKNVVFTGFIYDSDLPALYQLASLVVYPSFYEGFGLPVLEAMASGVPVVTSNTSSLPEVAEDAAVLVDPHKVSGITTAMEEVLTNDDLRNEMVKKGLVQARRFDWERTSKENFECFLNILN